MMEAQAPAGVALGAALIDAGQAADVRVTSVGHHRGEGLVRLVGTR
jgi:3-oxoacyl-[acyl-carrier-protein] synthase II